MFNRLNLAEPVEKPPSSMVETAAKSPRVLAVLLMLGTMMLYWPVIGHDFVNYDDLRYVVENRQVQAGLNLQSIQWAFCNPVSGNWHPLTMMSHMLDCELYGLKPAGHHLTSLLFHTLNTGMLFWLLWLLTGARWQSALVAAVFGWHPLHVESVAWVAERKDVLSACFGFLTLIGYVRHVRRQAELSATKAAGGSAGQGKSHPDLRFYWLACLCFALGLMCKPMLVTWPVVMLLLDYWPLGRLQPGTWRARLMEKAPFFALAAAACVITMRVQAKAGAMGSMLHYNMGLRMENALVSYGRYLVNLFWPHDLAVFYPYPESWPVLDVLLSAAVLTGVTGWLWKNRHQRPAPLMGWFWFLVTLVPVIGLVQVGKQAMADRYSYLPSVGISILITWGLDGCTRTWLGRRVISLAALAALALCVALTRQQLAYWVDSEALFRHALSVTPDNEVARNGLGVALVDKGQTNAAMAEFLRARSLDSNTFEPHQNIGGILAKRGETDAAMAEILEALRLKPDHANLHNILGTLYVVKGRYDDGTQQYLEALRLDPELADAYYNLGHLYSQLGRNPEAVKELLAAIQLQPRDVEASEELAQALIRSGQIDAAISDLQAGVALNPKDATLHFKLGNALAKKGRIDEGIQEFETAVRLKVDYAEAYNNLGHLFSAKGDIQEAVKQFQAAIRLKPDAPDAYYNLGNARLRQGQLQAAASEYQTVTRLSPDFSAAHYYLGICLEGLGKPAEAADEFQTDIRLKPNDSMAYNQLGLVLEKQGQWGEAIRQFQAALQLRPEYAEASNNLSGAVERQRRGAGSSP